MTCRFAPPTRQHLGLLALVIGATFTSATWAQAPSRGVAFVEVPTHTSTPDTPAALTPPAQATKALPKRRIDIGRSTKALLNLQRNAPAVHPRPIDAEQARRSYQRYLKSFETSIPEQYGAGLDLQK